MEIKAGKETDYNHFVEVNSENEYSLAVVTFCNRWAELMEEEINRGKDPSAVIIEKADGLSADADTDGITGAMYGCAVAALAKFWKYGDLLQQWHNNQYNYHGKGTANPAFVNVGERNPFAYNQS